MYLHVLTINKSSEEDNTSCHKNIQQFDLKIKFEKKRLIIST